MVYRGDSDYCILTHNMNYFQNCHECNDEFNLEEVIFCLEILRRGMSPLNIARSSENLVWVAYSG